MSYIDDHPTRFDFRGDVHKAINRVQKKFPFQTFANTYVGHPPGFGGKYDRVSVDFWGGGRKNGRYVGYRGKPLAHNLGDRVFRAIFNDKHKPNISWIIWRGRMWVRGKGWGPAPGGPPDSDAGHYKHIHVTFML